jgi:outer membrane protein assembly factor BamB
MVKKLVVGLFVVVVAVVGMTAAGFRLERGGSGWPRFVGRPTDRDLVLEADRARQREMAQPVVPAQTPAPAVATGAGPANEALANTNHQPALTNQPAQPLTTHHQPTTGSWPDFRGPRRDGVFQGPIRTDWPREGLRHVWKQPIGAGYASFVAADGRAFTIEQRRNQEVAAAYDIQTGRELWTNAWNAYFQESMGGDGPRATPTYHEGRVYALGAEGELRALEAATGKLIWRRNILSDNSASNISWGVSASPLIVDDKLVVQPGGRRGKSIVAYSRANGTPAWSALNDEAAYTSPMLVTLGGRRQILAVTATRIVGLTPENGTLVWEYPWDTYMGINVAQPILFSRNGRDRIFISAGYGHGAAVFELTGASDGRLQAKTVWENQRMKNKFTSSVLHNGHIYGLDESILASINVDTGEQNWKGGRYGYGQIMLAGDHIVVLTEEGEVVLVNATPARHEEVARFPAIEGKTWNHPAIAEGKLLVRNLQEMAAFDIAPAR